MTIYTDGAYSPSRDQGGWAFFVEEEQIPVTGGAKKTTNNRMELEAILQALDYCLQANKKEPVFIFTDSQYAVGTITKNWKRNTNEDILLNIDDRLGQLEKKKIQVFIEHVKGHNGTTCNEFVDKLANYSSQSAHMCKEFAMISSKRDLVDPFNRFKDKEIIL